MWGPALLSEWHGLHSASRRRMWVLAGAASDQVLKSGRAICPIAHTSKTGQPKIGLDAVAGLAV